MYFPDDFINEVLERNDVVELIGQFSEITDQFSMRRKSVQELLDKHFQKISPDCYCLVQQVSPPFQTDGHSPAVPDFQTSL